MSFTGECTVHLIEILFFSDICGKYLAIGWWRWGLMNRAEGDIGRWDCHQVDFALVEIEWRWVRQAVEMPRQDMVIVGLVRRCLAMALIAAGAADWPAAAAGHVAD